MTTLPLSTDRLCFPWGTKNFSGSQADLQNVRCKLFDRGYKIKELGRRKLPPRLIRVIRNVSAEIFDLHNAGRVPWLRVISNAPELLEALAIHIPVALALTTIKSVTTFTTAEMIELFTDRTSPYDPTKEISNSWLLFWSLLNNQVAGSAKFAGHFVDMLGYRMTEKIPTIFTYVSRGWVGGGKGTLSTLTEETKQFYGETVATMLERCAPALYINVKESASSLSKKLEF